MNGPRDRRRADALQQALERYERMLEGGADPSDVADEVAAGLLPDQRPAFAIAAALHTSGDRSAAQAPDPDPEFVAAVSARLRGAEVFPRRAARRRLGLVPLAAAACIALFAALLVPSLRSLPGDRLYGIKGLSEDTRLLFASGPAEARVRLDLAGERFSKVEALIDRSALLLAAGPGLHAVSIPENIDDPELADLIEQTLQEAGKQLEAAADILTTQRTGDASDLDELVAMTQRGHKLATEVAEDLPIRVQPPVLSTVVKLAKIEAAAKAARTKVDTAPTPPPCATPKPTPTPEPTATPEATDAVTTDATPAPTPLENATATAVPTADPQATPCTTPEPTPTPEPTADPAVEPSSEPTGAPGVEEGVDGAEDGDGSENDSTSANEGSQETEHIAADPSTA